MERPAGERAPAGGVRREDTLTTAAGVTAPIRDGPGGEVTEHFGNFSAEVRFPAVAPAFQNLWKSPKHGWMSARGRGN